MDSIEITTELNKIGALHSSLDETNPMTYIIFQETFRSKLSELQHAWIDSKIEDLNHKINEKIERTKSRIPDIALAMADIRDKSCDYGEMAVINS